MTYSAASTDLPGGCMRAFITYNCFDANNASTQLKDLYPDRARIRVFIGEDDESLCAKAEIESSSEIDKFVEVLQASHPTESVFHVDLYENAVSPTVTCAGVKSRMTPEECEQSIKPKSPTELAAEEARASALSANRFGTFSNLSGLSLPDSGNSTAHTTPARSPRPCSTIAE